MFGDNARVKLSADDLKMHVIVYNIKDYEIFQQGLDVLYDWSLKWHLKSIS